MTVREEGETTAYPLISDTVFNAFNVLSYIALMRELGFAKQELVDFLKTQRVTKIRETSVKFNGIEYLTYAAKSQNVSAASTVFEYMAKEPSIKEVVLLLDEVQDRNHPSETVTWLYETDYEFLNSPNIKKIIVGGHMYLNHKLRLLLAGIDESRMIEIILNIDSDHLDYFKDVEHIASSFDKFAKLVPSDGAVIAYDANPFVKSVIEGLPNAVTFGLGESCDYFASDIDFDNEGMPRFTVNHGGKELCRIALSVPGEHNVLNALSAFACGHILGVDVDSMVRTLENFSGIQRRFDVLGKTANNIKIIDDYAHHPTEIKATLSAVKKMKHNHMWCLFQPHTYTRTMALLDDFATSFTDADKVVLAEIYAAREKNIYKISSKSLMNRIKEEDPAKDVYFFSDFEEIANFVYNNAEPGDLVITMGAGDIYKVGEMILEKDKRF